MIHYRKIVLLGLLTVFTFVFTPRITTQVHEGKTTSVATIDPPSAEAAKGLIPAYISIPTAKVDTDIVGVGITKEGKLDVPPNYTQVGWYKLGTVPGEMGSAVLDGHVDNGGKVPGPFKHLRDVKEGDDIAITMSDGSILHYSVIVSEVYDIDKFPGKKVFHETGKQYLKIITCHGKYIPSIGTYNQRLIVTAVRVP